MKHKLLPIILVIALLIAQTGEIYACKSTLHNVDLLRPLAADEGNRVKDTFVSKEIENGDIIRLEGVGYRVLGKLGRGKVKLVERIDTKETLVLKPIHSSEAVAMERLHHPGALKGDVVKDKAGQLVLISEPVEGINFTDWVRGVWENPTAYSIADILQVSLVVAGFSHYLQYRAKMAYMDDFAHNMIISPETLRVKFHDFEDTELLEEIIADERRSQNPYFTLASLIRALETVYFSVTGKIAEYNLGDKKWCLREGGEVKLKILPPKEINPLIPDELNDLIWKAIEIGDPTEAALRQFIADLREYAQKKLREKYITAVKSLQFSGAHEILTPCFIETMAKARVKSKGLKEILFVLTYDDRGNMPAVAVAPRVEEMEFRINHSMMMDEAGISEEGNFTRVDIFCDARTMKPVDIRIEPSSIKEVRKEASRHVRTTRLFELIFKGLGCTADDMKAVIPHVIQHIVAGPAGKNIESFHGVLAAITRSQI